MCVCVCEAGASSCLVQKFIHSEGDRVSCVCTVWLVSEWDQRRSLNPVLVKKELECCEAAELL